MVARERGSRDARVPVVIATLALNLVFAPSDAPALEESFSFVVATPEAAAPLSP